MYSSGRQIAGQRGRQWYRGAARKHLEVGNVAEHNTFIQTEALGGAREKGRRRVGVRIQNGRAIQFINQKLSQTTQDCGSSADSAVCRENAVCWSGRMKLKL